MGEWAEKRGIRDQLVFATKVPLSVLYTLAFVLKLPPSIRPTISAP